MEVIPTAMQYHGRLALLWHDVIVERALDTLTRTSRPQAVQRKAAVVDPQSVITAIDHFCKHREWAMNVCEEKGAASGRSLRNLDPSIEGAFRGPGF
ncbi:catechol O-methyltransferase B-like [Oncorhynchus nerka]|uniref:catechol O-methyltransferase B-like n=1 Tax=Oncorhynchus nerka TaxID=8023 RepID=UPI0031B86CFF